jgi:O-succinylhomoserine sulfhydrylase
MERHASNALYIAQQLENHPKISWLKYPYLPSHPQYSIAKKQMKNGGGIICFDLKGGIESGRIFLDNLSLFSLTANLGDTRSIASHPASTTHAKLTEEERQSVNITPGLIRISVGLEFRDDILNDILQTSINAEEPMCGFADECAMCKYANVRMMCICKCAIANDSNFDDASAAGAFN